MTESERLEHANNDDQSLVEMDEHRRWSDSSASVNFLRRDDSLATSGGCAEYESTTGATPSGRSASIRSDPAMQHIRLDASTGALAASYCYINGGSFANEAQEPRAPDDVTQDQQIAVNPPADFPPMAAVTVPRALRLRPVRVGSRDALPTADEFEPLPPSFAMEQRALLGATATAAAGGNDVFESGEDDDGFNDA